MRTVWTSIVSKPRDIMSSIPSTIVRPLHDSGTPAGPNFTGMFPLPQNRRKGCPMLTPFREVSSNSVGFGGLVSFERTGPGITWSHMWRPP